MLSGFPSGSLLRGFYSYFCGSSCYSIYCIMGCCMSKRGTTRASRVARWRSTGIVGLRDSNLKCLPSDVLELERAVRMLDITHNKLVDIPLEIGSLVNIQRLILSENHLERLPITLGKLQSLKVLAIDDNRLTTLPDELGLLVRLERLSVSDNSLRSLPETIGSLRNLVQLNVSNNHLRFLPESIGSCFSLEELLANGNSIEDLPLSLCRLVNLKSLALSNNNVKQIEHRHHNFMHSSSSRCSILEPDDSAIKLPNILLRNSYESVQILYSFHKICSKTAHHYRVSCFMRIQFPWNNFSRWRDSKSLSQEEGEKSTSRLIQMY